MGKLLSKIFGNKEMRILMLGLDAAGKTSKYSIDNAFEHVELMANFLLNSNSLQTEAGPIGDHHSNGWIQRGNGHIQKCQVQCVGRGRSGQNPAALETLLYW